MAFGALNFRVGAFILPAVTAYRSLMLTRLCAYDAILCSWHFHLLLGWFMFLGVSAGSFGRFAVAIGEALTHLFKHPFGYRHIVDRGAAADLTKGYMFW